MSPENPAVGPFQNLEYGAIQVQVQIRPVTTENMRAHLEREAARIDDAVRGTQRPEKGIIVVDASVELVPPPTIRKLQADWTNENEDKLVLVLHAMGFVVPSALSRGAMTAVMWLIRPRWPMVAHPSLEAAIEWALAEARRVDARVDPRLAEGGYAAVRDDRARLLAQHQTARGAAQ